MPHDYVAVSSGSHPGTRLFRDRNHLRGAGSTILRREKAGEARLVEQIFCSSDVSCDYLDIRIHYFVLVDFGPWSLVHSSENSYSLSK